MHESFRNWNFIDTVLLDSCQIFFQVFCHVFPSIEKQVNNICNGRTLCGVVPYMKCDRLFMTSKKARAVKREEKSHIYPFHSQYINDMIMSCNVIEQKRQSSIHHAQHCRGWVKGLAFLIFLMHWNSLHWQCQCRWKESNCIKSRNMTILGLVGATGWTFSVAPPYLSQKPLNRIGWNFGSK